MPGHWEGDLVKGMDNGSAFGTLVERTNGYLIRVKMIDATATSAVQGVSAALNIEVITEVIGMCHAALSLIQQPCSSLNRRWTLTVTTNF